MSGKVQGSTQVTIQTSVDQKSHDNLSLTDHFKFDIHLNSIDQKNLAFTLTWLSKKKSRAHFNSAEQKKSGVHFNSAEQKQIWRPLQLDRANSWDDLSLADEPSAADLGRLDTDTVSLCHEADLDTFAGNEARGLH